MKFIIYLLLVTYITSNYNFFARGTKFILKNNSIKNIENINKTDELLDIFNQIIKIKDISVSFEDGYLVRNIETNKSYIIDTRSDLVLLYQNKLVHMDVKNYMNLRNKGDYFGVKYVNKNYQKYKIMVVFVEDIINFYNIWTTNRKEYMVLLDDKTIVML